MKGRSLGVLKREEISKAMGSCYPDFVVNLRKAVALVQDDPTMTPPSNSDVAGFDDIELFLADHELPPQADDTSEFLEGDVAEVLATTWKEKRAEIAKLQESRRFDQAWDLKRSFRVEIEEMKRQTKCNRCGRVGHWARECRQKRDPVAPHASSSSTTSKTFSKETGASYVIPEEPGVSEMPQFVASVGCHLTLVQQLSARVANSDSLTVLSESAPRRFSW